MRLTKVRISEFQSIRDSNEFEVGDITCLVGKNEAGKTSLLKALYRLNPIVAAEGKFDVTDDYPRTDVEDYRQDVEEGRRPHAKVVQATYKLEADDLQPIKEAFGNDVIKTPTLGLTKDYANKETFILSADDKSGLNYLYSNAQIPTEDASELKAAASVDAALAILKGKEQTAEIKRINEILTKVKTRKLNGYIYDTYLVLCNFSS